jgi:type I restriction enzyme S subunit
MQGRAPEGMDEATAALFPDSFEESELGAVPNGWNVGSLTDLCVIESGKRPADRSDVLSESCNIPLYGGAGLMGYTSESLFDDKKIVTGRVGTLGRVHVAYPPCWASDNVLVLSPRDEIFFSFVFQWLCGIDVHALNRGSTQPLLTQKDLGAQVNVIPPRTLLEKFEEISAALNQQIRRQTLQIETLTNLRDTLLPRLISGELRASSIAGDAA